MIRQFRKVFLGSLFLFLPLYAYSSREFVPEEFLSVVKDSDIIVMPQFPGGEEAMNKYLVLNVQMSESEENTPQWLVDRILYSLKVTASGEITKVKLKTPLFKLKGHISKEILDKAYWLVKNMPKWIPGTRNGQPEDMDCVVCVKLNLIYPENNPEKEGS